ncbi:MAG: PKD domain-containing protein, partial [Bacteroidia bacterium]|nr:PKD domain-containing protein [Bacteroidia bacterium]
MKKYYFLLLGVVYILNFTQLSAQNNEQRISNSITNKTSTPAVLEEEPFDAHRLAVKKYLTPQYLQNSLLPLLQKVGVVSNDFSAFLDYCDPVLSDFKSDLLKLRLDKNFVTSFQLDSLIQTYLPLFSTQKDRFYKGLTPLEPAYANSQNGSELKIINPNNLNNPPQQANGPCVNTDFSDGTTNGWTGSYGTSTIATQTTEKTCAGFLKTYNASTDKCCSLLGSCSAWTASDGYLTANLNNPNQTAGFSSAPNNTAANAGTPGVHVVMTSGFDPIVPGNALPVVPPTGGNSLRLGLAKSGYNAQAIRQTFLVTNANKNFIYKFACVLNDPETGHSNVELPYFKIRMYDQSNNIISCASLDVSTSNAVQVGGFTKVNGQPIFWKNWTEVTIPLNPYMGQNVTIEFVTSNCAQSGHYGYAYVSAECMRQEILASSPAICGGTTVTLTAPPGLASYNWTGPGIQSGQGTQTVVINTAGTYHVSMTTNTTPPFVPCNFSIDTVIGGNPSRPFAKFNAPSGCYGSPIVFTDQSTPTGQITAWEWDFDNNTTIDATTQSPSHTFPAPGTYPVKLRVTWPPCMADTTINVLVTAKPNANFSAPPVCFGNATQFTNSTNLNGASNPQYTWDFNDPSSGTNNTSNSVSPSHLFTAAGTYNVKLTVNTPNCSSDTTIAIKVSGLPKAQFTANDICFGGTTAFTDNSTTSTGTLSTWVWIFSDPNNTNNTSNTQNPTHTYTGAGSFPVTLVVTNSDNCSDDTTINAVVYAPPVANFAFKTFCEGITLNTSGGLITSGSLMGTGTTQAPSTIATYTWDLNNDGTFETSGQNVTVTPAMFSTAGNHPISLTIATNKGCRDTVSGNFVVLPTPTVDAGTTQSVCFNTCATLTGTTSSLTYQWSPAADIANPTNLTTQACPIATTLYHLEVMDGYTYPVFT